MKLLVGFAPWIAFLVLSRGGTLFWLDAGLITAAALTVVMGVAGVHRGAILWAGAVFFGVALVAVVGFRSTWVIGHMGVLASGFLFLTAALSMALGRPFTEAYAREHAPQEAWGHPAFRRSCYLTTGVWTGIFLVNTLLNAVKLASEEHGDMLQALEYACLLGGVVFTSWYAAMKRRRAAGQ